MGIKRVSLSRSALCSPPSALRPTPNEPGSRTLKPILHGEPVLGQAEHFPKETERRRGCLPSLQTFRPRTRDGNRDPRA